MTQGHLVVQLAAALVSENKSQAELGRAGMCEWQERLAMETQVEDVKILQHKCQECGIVCSNYAVPEGERNNDSMNDESFLVLCVDLTGTSQAFSLRQSRLRCYA